MGLAQLADQLESMIREAKETRILGGARIDRDRAYDLIDQMRDQAAEAVRLDEDTFVRRGAGVLVPLDELDDVLHSAKSVPFTDSIRADRDELLEILGRVRRGATEDHVLTRAEAEQRPINRPKVARLLDGLDALVRNAKPVPLTSQVRLQKRAFGEIAGELRECGPPAMLPALDALDDTLQNALPVPLTDEVRVEGAGLSEIIQQMRAAFSQGTPAAPTN
jgi:hypothetical protein